MTHIGTYMFLCTLSSVVPVQRLWPEDFAWLWQLGQVGWSGRKYIWKSLLVDIYGDGCSVYVIGFLPMQAAFSLKALSLVSDAQKMNALILWPNKSYLDVSQPLASKQTEIDPCLLSFSSSVNSAANVTAASVSSHKPKYFTVLKDTD